MINITPSSLDSNITNGSGSNAVNVQDGGNVLSVDDAGSSLTVDGTVAATQSGDWSQIPDRPSQKTGRTYKEGFISNATTDQTLYTVTVGKILYVTSITFSAYNSSARTTGNLTIRDSTTIKIPFSFPSSGVAIIPSSMYMVFQEPKQFAINFNVDIVTGTITYSISFTGYEE